MEFTTLLVTVEFIYYEIKANTDTGPFRFSGSFIHFIAFGATACFECAGTA